MTNATADHSPLAASISTIAAAIAIPFSLLPLFGLGLSALALGFSIAVSIWIQTKRALASMAIAGFAVLIAIVSSFIFVHSAVAEGKEASAKLAQVQNELGHLKAQIGNDSDANIIGDIIKKLDPNNHLTGEQANLIGRIIAWIFEQLTGNDDQ